LHNNGSELEIEIDSGHWTAQHNKSEWWWNCCCCAQWLCTSTNVIGRCYFL